MSVLERFSLEGRVAVVTGAGSGLGHAVGSALHEAGASVALVGRTNEPLRAAAERLGPRAIATPADVTRAEELERALATVRHRLGVVDTVVHCAGTHLKLPFPQGDPDQERRLMDTHVHAGLGLARAVAPGMQEKGEGVMLFVGSMAALMGVPEVPVYSAAKGAVLSLARSLAVELGPSGIRVNVITPGWVVTPMTEAALGKDAARRERILQRTPLGRLGDPADVGAAAVYLCSPAAAFVSGANLVVDGGAAVGF